MTGSNTALNNKHYGFAAEQQLLEYFREHGLSSERLHLAGTEDEGDLTVSLGWAEGVPEGQIVVQLKTFTPRHQDRTERALSPARVKGWWKDLAAQREAYRAHRGLAKTPPGMLVVKVKGQSWDDALIIHRLGDWAS
jgi:hypothetical protein